MNPRDAISSADLEPGEYPPTDVCIDCGAEIAVGFLHCAACAAVHDERDCLEFTDIRRG